MSINLSLEEAGRETHKIENFGRCISMLQYAQLISLVFINLNKLYYLYLRIHKCF